MWDMISSVGKVFINENLIVSQKFEGVERRKLNIMALSSNG